VELDSFPPQVQTSVPGVQIKKQKKLMKAVIRVVVGITTRPHFYYHIYHKILESSFNYGNQHIDNW
jgi:hypothetical protein